jgi:hypothetical protein
VIGDRFKVKKSNSKLKSKFKVRHSMDSKGCMYNTLPLINTRAIRFTIKVVVNLLFVVRETTG